MTEPAQEIRYRQAFLTTFKSFTSAEEVFELLVAQFNITPPSTLNAKEMEVWKDKKLRPTRRRMLNALHTWVDDYGLLQDDPYLAPRISHSTPNIPCSTLHASHLAPRARIHSDPLRTHVRTHRNLCIGQVSK